MYVLTGTTLSVYYLTGLYSFSPMGQLRKSPTKLTMFRAWQSRKFERRNRDLSAFSTQRQGH